MKIEIKKSILTNLIALMLFAATNVFGADRELIVDISVGEAYKASKYKPQLVIWVEDEAGKFIETLYITKKEGKDKYLGAKTRKEALPVWRYLSKYKKKKKELDGVAGATKKKGFKVSHKITNYPPKFNIYLEINKSFDYNEYFAKKLKPNEKGYNSGYSGQPSLVYGAAVNKLSKIESEMKLIGHGSETGANGDINMDISKLTSALELIDKIVISIKE